MWGNGWMGITQSLTDNSLYHAEIAGRRFLKSMKYLVSGSGGFIASALSKRFLDQWAPITQSVLYDPTELRRLFEKEKPEAVFHLASYGNHYNQKDNEKNLEANVISAFNIFEAAKCKVFSFSTSSVNLPVQTMYSTTKLMGEVLSNLYPNVVVVRPYSIFGEGEADFRFIPTVCRSLILDEELTLDPSPVHDWVYVENFVDILLDNLKTDEKVLEIGTGIGSSNQSIVEKLARISGKTCKVNQVGSLRSYDNEGWWATNPYKMKTSLDVGLLNTYKYYEHKFKN